MSNLGNDVMVVDDEPEPSTTKPPSLPDMADTQPFQLDTQMVVAQLLQDEPVVSSTKPGPAANQEPCQPLGPLPELRESPATANNHDQAGDMASNVPKAEAIPESSKPTFEPLSSPEKASAGCMFAVLRMFPVRVFRADFVCAWRY